LALAEAGTDAVLCSTLFDFASVELLGFEQPTRRHSAAI